MADDYHHGVRVTEINEGTRTISTVAEIIMKPGTVKEVPPHPDRSLQGTRWM